MVYSVSARAQRMKAPEEAKEFYKVAGALLINIGTMTKANEQDILEIGKIANQQGTPIVFDPVAVGASSYRKAFCQKFLSEVKVSVIKGNASEILTLVDATTTMKGTDGETDLDVVEIAKRAHEELNTTIVLTGKDDVVVQGGKVVKLSNGSPLLAKITGAGCLLGGIVASFLFREENPTLQVLEEAVSIYNIVFEIAEKDQQVNGPGTFLPKLLDQMYNIDFNTYQHQVKRQEVE